jgi:hypothetical protein
MWATNSPILPPLAKANRLPNILPECSTWNTIRVSALRGALGLGSCRYSLRACIAERPAGFSNIPSGNHSSCSYRQFRLVFVGLDATAVSHVSGRSLSCNGHVTTGALNPNQPILSQPPSSGLALYQRSARDILRPPRSVSMEQNVPRGTHIRPQKRSHGQSSVPRGTPDTFCTEK